MNNTAKLTILWLGFLLLSMVAVSRLAAGAGVAQAAPLAAGVVGWRHLSSADGELPTPADSTQQVLTLILDIDNDGRNDFVLGSRRAPGESLVWYRRGANGWTRHTIEPTTLQLEAGGAFYDIDGDGDLDIAAGNNNKGNEVWWWENPYPNYSADGWTRRTIKNSGASKHHDMMFGQFDDDPATEFVFWNQSSKKLLMVDVPADPTVQPWPEADTIHTAASVQFEGLTQADVDGDGRSDVIGGGYWFKHTGGHTFTANRIELTPFARVAAGQIVPGGRPEIVQVPGDTDGPGRWFEWDGSDWVGRDLPGGTIKHGHSLALGDVDGDGHLDIFIGEMRFEPGDAHENPEARSLIFWGDSQGGFTPETLAVGYSHHESRLGDLDGDGDLDILGKSFTWDTPRVDVWLNDEGSTTCESMTGWRTHVIDTARPWRAVFIDAADIDGDGLNDIVAGAWWYRNPGAPGGAWARQEIGAPLNEMALVHDFDGDGDPDVLGTVRDSDASQPHFGSAFVWARNDGGTFTILNNVGAGNGDFLQGAVAAAGAPGDWRVFLSWHRGNALQSLGVPADPSSTQWPVLATGGTTQNEDLSAGDIDRDGDIDLMLGTVWLENDGGAWTAHTLHTTSERPDRNRLADIDADGRLDVVVGYEAINSQGQVAWYRAPADPTQPWDEEVIATLTGPMSLDVGDADGDGDVDVVVGEHNTRDAGIGRVMLYEQGSGRWTPHLVANGAEHHDGTQFTDIDADGDLDVISIGWTHDDVLLYEQLGCDDHDDPAPSATPTEPGNPSATSTATPTPTASPVATASPTPSETPSGAEGYIYISARLDGRMGALEFADEDILRFDTATAVWSLFFDGSDVGLATRNVDAFHRLPDGRLLLSLDTALKMDGVGRVDDSDVLVFTPATLGEQTSGSFAFYFDGSDVGLSTNAEDVDALTLSPGGALLVSTTGKASIDGATAEDEDLLRFTPAQLGSNTAGTWTLAFDGSAAGLVKSSEDVSDAWQDAAGGLRLSMVGSFTLGSLRGSAGDVVACDATCGAAAIFWSGALNGFSGGIDALHVE